MSAQVDEEIEDLLTDDLLPAPAEKKGAAVPLRRTAKQSKAVAKRQAEAERKAELQAQSVRLAQIVNLHIGGYSLAQIAASTGSTPEEIDRLLSADTARYIRSQPALRTYVRNWVSERYMKMIEADWTEATDPNSKEKLEHQDRVMRMLNNMAKLHGAEAPTQTEMKIEAAPETVDALVARIAQAQGMGYDTSIFDIPAEDIHEVAESSVTATQVSGNVVDQSREDEPDDGF